MRMLDRAIKVRRKIAGVTLMELMIVVVIIGILGAIAYPNYRQYAARAKRNEAKAELLKIATLQERFYLQNNTYTADMTNLGFASASSNVSDSESYVINVTAADANDFTATAVYQHTDDEASVCKNFQIDGSLTKTSSPSTECWVKTR